MKTLFNPSETMSTVGQERVLVALSGPEQEMFFPGVSWVETLGCPLFQADTSVTRGAAWERALAEIRPTVILSAWSTPALPERWLDEPGLPLRYVCHVVGSVRQLVPRSFVERGGVLSNWGGLAGETVAEHALLLALATLRRQPAWRPFISRPPVDSGRPATALLGTRTLRGRRVGIHGFGHVARSLVRLLRPFGVRISAFSPGVPPSLMREMDVEPAESLLKLAAGSEVFFECEAVNAMTRDSVDARVIDAMPSGCVFVNVGRGHVVREEALLAAAREDRVRIALDVVVNDPVGPDSPFMRLPDAILTPHIAGPTADQFPDCGRFALENIARHLRGEPVEAAISPELYDRST